MVNCNGGRTCPKCGMNLGQKHLCPICDQAEPGQDNTSGIVSSASSQGGDYVSRVIEFVEMHPYDWDEEFNSFYDGLAGDHDFEACYYEACSKVSDILKKNTPNSEKISGSKTIHVMRELRTVFPDLTSEASRLFSMRLLETCVSTPVPSPSDRDPVFIGLYRRAIEQNDAESQNNLGNVYWFGEGVSEDTEKAVKWYRKAAEQGYAEAQYNLGYCYENGIGIRKDETEAVKWYRKAAEQGYAGAQNNLGYCYENGLGIRRDDAEAVKWYRKAAEQGRVSAQYNLGNAYEYGKGVSKDKAEAVKWYRIAAKQGDEDARIRLKELGC